MLKNYIAGILVVLLLLSGTAHGYAPSDPLWGKQQWLHTNNMYGIHMARAWPHTKGGKNIIVAVIDTGVNYLHPDLAANIWKNPREVPGDRIDNDGNGLIDDYRGFNFFDRNADLTDKIGHGTHIAGIIAAVADNNTGIAGIAPHAQVMPLKAFGSTGQGCNKAITDAIHYAAANGARVINMSFTGQTFNWIIYEAIARHPNVLFVAGAGNSGANNDLLPVSPAGFTIPWCRPPLSNVLTVGALGANGSLTSTSNFGSRSVCIAAPGENVLSTKVFTESQTSLVSTYVLKSGTSMAAAFVSGAAALVLSHRHNLSPEHVISILKNSATKLPALNGKVASGGTLNIWEALSVVPLS